ncbi:hypothetical protein PG984_005645 [Apiospora sp. TS-2023a]
MENIRPAAAQFFPQQWLSQPGSSRDRAPKPTRTSRGIPSWRLQDTPLVLNAKKQGITEEVLIDRCQLFWDRKKKAEDAVPKSTSTADGAVPRSGSSPSNDSWMIKSSATCATSGRTETSVASWDLLPPSSRASATTAS